MKFKKKLLCGICIIAVLFSILNTISPCMASAKIETKGVWVSTVYNIDYPNTQTTNAEKLKEEAETILDKCYELGINTVFLQVRPTSDAIYHSNIFPYSRWISGQEGVEPEGGFDALSYWINGAHSRGMQLHAWINPYRITIGGASLDTLAPNNPAKLHPEYTFKYSNGNYYYNPAMPEVRQLILNGILEIAENYDIDGIHFDDYFYPDADMDDYADYIKYNKYGLTIEDWRRSNCDMLIKDVSDALRQRGVTFGISPSGIWANKSYDSRGSDTNGHGSYSHLYADTLKWAKEGWIDYIIPQIYWEIGHSLADYKTLAYWWSSQLENSPTKLYIGMADYRSEDAAAGSVWEDAAALVPEFELNDTISKITGEVHFSYKSIISNSNVEQMIYERNNKDRDDGVTVYVNGKQIEFDQPPIIERRRTLVPMRMIFEALGMNVEWDGFLHHITASDSAGKTIEMDLNSTQMLVNGSAVQLDAMPRLLNNRTLVPVRAISEALNANVEWDGEKKIIYITTN